MSHEVFIHDVRIAIGGFEVWPLTRPVIVGLVAVAFLIVATTVALMYRGRDSARD